MLWISIHEFVRNQFVLLNIWEAHYSSLGMVFKTEPVNGMVWGLWALVFSLVLYRLSKMMSLGENILWGWVIGFILMWLVIGNMQVLPYATLLYAIPWSLLEVAGSVWIIHRMKR
jgi:hypothetical protein